MTFTLMEVITLVGIVCTILSVFYAMQRNAREVSSLDLKQEHRFTKLETEVAFIKGMLGVSKRIGDLKND